MSDASAERPVQRRKQMPGMSVDPVTDANLAARIAAAPRLTPRERDLVRGIVGGLSNAQIAQHLDIGEQTVRNRLSVVFRKVGVSNRLQLALEAVRHQMVPEASLRRFDCRT